MPSAAATSLTASSGRLTMFCGWSTSQSSQSKKSCEAWQPRSQASQDFFDCELFDVDHPQNMVNRPEEAVSEVAAALGITDTVASFYDFRHPPASGLFI